MSESTDLGPSNREHRIEELVDEFVRARRSEYLIDRDEVVAANPDLEPDLSKRLAFAESLVRTVRRTESEKRTRRSARIPNRAERMRCPHCGNIIPIVQDSNEVTCGSCGSTVDKRAEAALSYSPSSTEIAHFNLIERVGQGGFGVVYRAMDTRLQRVVALKIPRRGYFGTTDEEARFLREARSAATLNHPNIVRVYEVGTERGSHYIATEFIEGMNVADHT